MDLCVDQVRSAVVILFNLPTSSVPAPELAFTSNVMVNWGIVTPLAGWQLPECFAHLRRLLEARLKKHGSREYVQVLRLLETFDLAELTHAIEDALRLGTISFDAVRHLLLCRIERRPPRLDMENYPHLPLAQVRTTQAADYMSLLVAVCA